MPASTSRDYYAVSAWALQNLSYRIVRAFFIYIKHLHISCPEVIDGLKKPVIVAAMPHLSHLDVLVITAALPRHQLPVRWLADRKLFDSKFSSLWFKLWGAIPVSREHDGGFQSDDIDWILGFIIRGNCIGLFPECCLVGNQFGKIHKNILCSAIQQQIKVIPAVLKNMTLRNTGMTFSSSRPDRLPNIEINQQLKRPKVIISKPLKSCDDLMDSLTV